MSRGPHDGVRDQDRGRGIERPTEVQVRNHTRDTDFLRHLTLPRGTTLERVEGRERTHLLDEADLRTVATIGAFRVVSIEDLDAAGDLRRLSNGGLITNETLTDIAGSQRIVPLTSEGKAVLEAHPSPGDGPDQSFFAGIVKPRELAHDAGCFGRSKRSRRASMPRAVE